MQLMLYTTQQLLQEGIKILAQNNSINTAHLDARILLQFVLDITHEQLILQSNQICNTRIVKKFLQLIQRRVLNEPVAYIIGHKEFFDKKFIVNKHTLIPRPDTECLIEYAIKVFDKNQPIRILDIGTGTGCLAICLATYYINSLVIATDCSKQALKIANKNINEFKLTKQISTIYNQNFAENIAEKFHIIISNPPYIKSAEIIKLVKDVQNYEPATALDGGVSGIEPYKIIAAQAHDLLYKNGYVIVEIGINQHDEITNIFVTQGLKLHTQLKDLAGIIRGLVFTN
jgi:release factor glutamine methyltransferase